MPRPTGRASIPTKQQVSAGGVAYRKLSSGVEIAIIKVGPIIRWQLPKGIVDEGESPEEAAVREVREEAGINAVIQAPLDKIEYWYVSGKGAERVRYHKFVYFYLMKYRSGKTNDHDHEVLEARWVKPADALRMLSFKSERELVERARELIG